MTDLDSLKAAVRDGDATAFIPLADELNACGHPDGPELCDLANIITTASDWPTVYTATAIFLTLIGD